MNPNLWLIIPCYNEEDMIRLTMAVLGRKLQEMIGLGMIAPESKIVLVDDGSTDRTWPMIRERREKDGLLCGIRLSRNFGQQNALLAGMLYACGKCDCMISMDADLQDDVNALPDFIEKYRQGYQIVYGVRSDRSADTWLKRNTAALFYRLMDWLGTETVAGHSECRLLGDKALRALQAYQESGLFLRGIIPKLGFASTTVCYARQKRVAGETKYSGRKLVHLALDGMTASSDKLLRIIPLLACLCLGLGIIGAPCNQWTSAGLQMLSLGIVGAYTAKIYAEVRCRPRYIIDEITDGGK